jgi:hypothetical protein
MWEGTVIPLSPLLLHDETESAHAASHPTYSRHKHLRKIGVLILWKVLSGRNFNEYMHHLVMIFMVPLMNMSYVLAITHYVMWRMASSGMLRTSCRFLQEPQGVTSQKMPFFIVTTVKTTNLTSLCNLFPLFNMNYGTKLRWLVHGTCKKYIVLIGKSHTSNPQY